MNKVTGLTLVVALVALGVSFFSGGETRIETIIREQIGASPGPDVLNEIDFSGGVTLGHPLGIITASSTHTLTAAQLVKVSYTRVIIDGDEATDLTITLPASSTLAHFVPSLGDYARKCFLLTGTTTDSRLIFAAGTGIDMRYASSTGAYGAALGAPDLASIAGQEVCLEFWRQPQDVGTALGDISAVLTVFEEAD